jgi:hypothetical protein
VNTLTRLRQAQKRTFKAQRRLWLLQAAFWSTVGLASLAAVGAVVVRYRSRDTDGPPPPADGLPHL